VDEALGAGASIKGGIMNDKQIKELSNNLMGCGCVMFLIPIFGIILIFGLMMIASLLGIIE
jgi:hypothetical protein